MSRKLLGAAAVTALAVLVPVGMTFAHGHQGTHPSGRPSSVPTGAPLTSSPPSSMPSLPSQAAGHGHGSAVASQVHQDVGMMQSLQRQIVSERHTLNGTLRQIRMAIAADVKAGDTAAVQSATTSLQQILSTARTALQDQHQAAALQHSSQNASSSSSSASASATGPGSALEAIISFRQNELVALDQMETELQALLAQLQPAPSSSSSSSSSSSTSG